MTTFDLIEFTNSLHNIDESDIPKIEEITENTYECSACGTLVQVDPALIYSYYEWKTYSDKDKNRMKYWHSKYPYSKEIKPGQWLTFCRRVCEIKYDRQYEEDWEFPVNKR